MGFGRSSHKWGNPCPDEGSGNPTLSYFSTDKFWSLLQPIELLSHLWGSSIEGSAPLSWRNVLRLQEGCNIKTPSHRMWFFSKTMVPLMAARTTFIWQWVKLHWQLKILWGSPLSSLSEKSCFCTAFSWDTLKSRTIHLWMPYKNLWLYKSEAWLLCLLRSWSTYSETEGHACRNIITKFKCVLWGHYKKKTGLHCHGGFITWEILEVCHPHGTEGNSLWKRLLFSIQWTHEPSLYWIRALVCQGQYYLLWMVDDLQGLILMFCFFTSPLT